MELLEGNAEQVLQLLIQYSQSSRKSWPAIPDTYHEFQYRN